MVHTFETNHGWPSFILNVPKQRRLLISFFIHKIQLQNASVTDWTGSYQTGRKLGRYVGDFLTIIVSSTKKLQSTSIRIYVSACILLCVLATSLRACMLLPNVMA